MHAFSWEEPLKTRVTEGRMLGICRPYMCPSECRRRVVGPRGLDGGGAHEGENVENTCAVAYNLNSSLNQSSSVSRSQVLRTAKTIPPVVEITALRRGVRAVHGVHEPSRLGLVHAYKTR